MDKFKVDILMITYNHQNFIEQAIDGVISQLTDFKFRLQIFDDCSTDNTEEKTRKKLNHSNSNLTIVYHRNQQNLGVFKNGKLSYDAFDGEYVALCEGDDYWIDPLKIQKQIDLLESTGNDFCYTDFDIYYNDEQKFDKFILKNKKGEINHSKPLLSRGIISTASWVIKGDFFKNFDPLVNDVVDKAIFLLIEFIRVNGKIVYLPDSTTVYRKWNGSASNQVFDNKRYLHHKSAFEFMMNYYEKYYPYDLQTRIKIISLAINILPEVYDNKDFDLINRLKTFLNESEIDITEIVTKFEEKDKFKKNFESLENSRLRKYIKKFRK
jgi:glucosyltransferase